MGGAKDKIMRLFKTYITENYSKPRKSKTKKQSLEKIFKTIKDITDLDIRQLFELKYEDYYKPVRVGNFYSSNCIEYIGNGDRNRTLSSEEYLSKIRTHLKDIINNLKKSDT